MLHVAKIAFSVGEVAAAHALDRRTAARLAAARAQDLGPSFIKMGQFASTRGDLLSPEYFEEFARLRDDVRADGPEVARGTVCRSLGIDSLSEVFAEFEDTPDASASVAQVHRAKLLSGQTVAVKVIKHGVRDAIENDLRAARTIEGVLSGANPSMKARLRRMLDRYSAVLRRETDFEAEAAAASKARETLRDALGDEVIVPLPIIKSPDAIVMEYVPSIPIRRARDGAHITSLVMESVLSLITAGDGFHQDPHEGNLGVVREGGSERLVIYDFGNVASLSQDSLDGLLEAGMAFQVKDADMLADALLKHRLVLPNAGFSPSQVKPVLMDMILQGFEYVRTMDIRSFDPAKIDKDAAHSMTLAEEVNGVMRSVTMAEGVCKSAHRGFDLQRSIDQFLAVHSANIAITRARRDIGAIIGFLM